MFPLLSPEPPRSLSALRLEFLAQTSLETSAPPLAKAAAATSQSFAPDMVIEQTLPLRQPSRSEPTAPAVNTPVPAVTVSSGLVKSDEGSRSALVSVPQPATTKVVVRRGWRKMHHKSRFVAYWKGVADSFRRDVRAFQADCANLMRSKAARSTDAAD